MYDATATDSPHLAGIQPDWRDLPQLCEIIHVFWQSQDQTEDEIRDQLLSHGTPNKVENQLRLLSEDKLNLLEEGNMTPDAIWLANRFSRPTQQRLTPEETVAIGAKEQLNEAEQSLLQSIFFRKNWLPMLATINQLLTNTTSIKETDTRATEFRKRVDHLSGYANVKSVNSWKKKAQAHFSWAEDLGLAAVSNNMYEPTALTRDIDRSLRQHYHPDWPIK
jgi:ribosomal protein L17